MSVNFYHNFAIMAGIEGHMFFNVGPPPPTGTPIPLFPYWVALPFCWPPATFWNRTGKVTADTHYMIDQDFSLLLVPHTNVGGVPGPAQVVKVLEITATSGSEVFMGIGSVTGEGDPLGACLAACVGLNLNCWEVGDHPTAPVLCVCSVKTTPSLLDYGLAVLKWISVGFLGEFLGKLGGGALAKLIKKIPKAVWEFIVKQVVVNTIEYVAQAIRAIARALGY